MTIVVPPAPIDAPFTSSNWVDWYEKVRRVINSAAPVDLGSSQVSGVLPVIHGGTGTAVPALTPGTNIAITGTWPFNAIGFTGILAKANGGTGTATPALVAGTGITLSGTWPAQTVGVTPNTYVLRGGDTMTGALAVPTFSTTSGLNLLTTATDTTPTTVVTWDTRHSVFGAASNAATGLGVSVNKSTDTVYLTAVTPNVAWRGLEISASSFSFKSSGGGTTFFVSSAGVITDGNGFELGLKNQPAGTVTSGTLTTAERGRCVQMSAGITLPAGVFSSGDMIYLLNDSLGSFTITQGVGLTLRLAGTASTGNRTIAQIGMGWVRYYSSTIAVIGGFGVT